MFRLDQGLVGRPGKDRDGVKLHGVGNAVDQEIHLWRLHSALRRKRAGFHVVCGPGDRQVPAVAVELLEDREFLPACEAVRSDLVADKQQHANRVISFLRVHNILLSRFLLKHHLIPVSPRRLLASVMHEHALPEAQCAVLQ